MADKSLQALTTKLAQIADDTNKSIKPDVKEIKDAVCGGILSSLMSINKKLDNVDKQNRLNKLTGKITSANGNKNLIKNTNSISNTLNKILLKMDKMSDKGRTLTRNNFRRENNDRGFGGLSNSIDAIKKLKNINIKDFILTKLKLKHLKQIMSKSLEMFREFKNQKEVENTMNFINASTEMMGKLAKTAKIAGSAQRGSKAIQKIFLGGKRDKNGGLLGLFQKIDENKDKIERGKKSMSNILKACGSMFLTSIILTGVAAVAIPAMLGALLVKGVIWLMTGPNAPSAFTIALSASGPQIEILIILYFKIILSSSRYAVRVVPSKLRTSLLSMTISVITSSIYCWIILIIGLAPLSSFSTLSKIQSSTSGDSTMDLPVIALILTLDSSNSFWRIDLRVSLLNELK